MSERRFVAENGLLATNVTANSQFMHITRFADNVYVDGDLLFVGGNLHVVGDLIYTNTEIAGDLAPTIDGSNLGNNTHRFDLYARNILVFGNVHPNSTGLLLGNTARRWNVHATNISASGSVSVTDSITASTISVTGSGGISVNHNVSANHIIVSHTISVAGNVSVGGNLSISGVLTVSGYDLTHGSIITNTATVSSTSPTIVDHFPSSGVRGGKYFITVTQGSANTHILEILFCRDDTNAYLTKYGEVAVPSTGLGTFDVNLNTTLNRFELSFTAASAASRTVRVLRTTLAA